MQPVSPFGNRSVVRNRLGLFVRIFVVAVLLSLLRSPALAVGCQVPYSHFPMPAYFNGTNCLMVCLATTSTGYINHIQLFINGTLVKEQFFTTPTIVQPGIYFDSTEFADGSTITITLKAWDSQGHFGTGSNSAPAKNRACVFANNTLGTEAERLNDITTSATAMNHTVISTDQDHKPAILQKIPPYNVFFIYTHGNPTGFVDCFGSTADPTEFLNATEDIAPAVGNKSASQPPYNFVHIDGCNTAGTIEFPDPTIANSFGITSSSTNRAFLGWQTELLINENNRQWTQRVWNSLKNRSTIFDAVVASTNAGEPQDENGNAAMWDIIGDLRTKVHGVYLGSGTQWYR